MTTPQPATDFPVPPDLEGFWQWDKMHCPRPQTPLTQEIFLNAVSRGFCNAMEEFAGPVGLAYRVINYYAYMGLVPLDFGTETIEGRNARYQEKMALMVPKIGELWEHEWLPSILPDLDKARSLDYAAMRDAELLDTLDELRQEFLHRYVIHGRINFVTIAASWYADFYNETFQPSDSTEPYLSLQGFPTRSVDAGRGLWRLSRMVRNDPGLMRSFEEVEPKDLVSHLERSDQGRRFVSEFRDYLEEFGWRSDAFELSDPTWRENSLIPVNALQGYIHLDEEGDPDASFQDAVQQRERLLAQARERLAPSPDKLARFNELYEAARYYLNVTEDHNFYIDQVGHGVMRLPILEIGRRLVLHGAITDENEVFMLFLAEIREGLAGKDLRSLVAQRKAEIEKWSKVLPPPALGEPPPPSDDPFAEAVEKMFGMPPEPSHDPSIITGIAASPGTVQGRAKVVRRLSEAGKVEPGDVLVCEMTMPAWTPLFSTVSAVVADTGGVLSHCAIVAREYRLPCVVQTIVGTAAIKDGMLLTVDGSKGIVRIDAQGRGPSNSGLELGSTREG